MTRRILVIHHSHTDIGYTESQNRIESWHIDFIRQAIKYATEHIESKYSFRWNCESFWAVEKFIQDATDKETEIFIDLVKNEYIGLSGSYLNFNELLDQYLLNQSVKRATDFGNSIDYRIKSAMTADINGYSWGFLQALFDNGIENLFSCVHTHHGMYPLHKKHIPFWWQTPSGNKILVWNGEHYHFGNELGIMPGATASYLIKDECDADMIFHDNWKVAEIRIPRFWKELERDGYPYEFIPLMISGLRTDNSPPNDKILSFIEQWNSEHADTCIVEMATLDQFFDLLREEKREIPIYSGDWPDWWSDGPASFPSETKMFRQTQRDYSYYRKLLNHYPTSVTDVDKNLENDLLYYAEHTFSHADSVSQPWNFMTDVISSRKKAYAALAYESVSRKIDSILYSHGATKFSADMPLMFKAINPYDHQIAGLLRFRVGHYEFNEKYLNNGAEVRNVKTDVVLKNQIEFVSGAAEFCIYDTLDAREEKTYKLTPLKTSQSIDKERSSEIDTIENSFVKISWNENTGIVEWIDKINGIDLLRKDRTHNPFTIVHEITPVDELKDITAVRGEMVLNRKGKKCLRTTPDKVKVKRILSGLVYDKLVMNYKISKTFFYNLELTIFKEEPRIDIVVQFVKDNYWRPENLYLALPFGIENGQMWLNKSGANIRPRIDQLPGTLIDFYTVQDGLAIVNDNYGLVISTPDNHLIQPGPLEYQERLLHNPKNPKPDDEHIYSWLMTNYWETNFSAGLGGFYEFRFRVKWGKELNNVEQAMQVCNDLNQDIRVFRLNNHEGNKTHV